MTGSFAVKGSRHIFSIKGKVLTQAALITCRKLNITQQKQLLFS